MIEILNFIKDQINTNQFFSGAISATILASLLVYFKKVPALIWQRIERKIVYNVNIYQYSEIFVAFEMYLATHHKKKYRNVEASLSNENFYHDNDYGPQEESTTTKSNHDKKESAKIKITHHSDFFIIFYKSFPIHINKGREKLENANSIKNVFMVSFKIKSLFGKNIINSMLDDAIREYHEYKNKKISTDIYINSYSSWENVKKFKKSFDNVIISGDEKTRLLNDLDSFLSKRSQYQKLDIPYKRGYLFYGSPGNGKTSLATAMAGHLKKNICYLNLRSVQEDQYLQDLFARIPNNSILVIEDIDASFDGRKTIGKGKITFSALLNCLDGIFYKEDLITIITTNHINKLDDALIRPGRIDFKLHIGNPNKISIEQYLSLYYGENITLQSYSNTYSMAEIMNFCTQNSKNECINIICD